MIHGNNKNHDALFDHKKQNRVIQTEKLVKSLKYSFVYYFFLLLVSSVYVSGTNTGQ